MMKKKYINKKDFLLLKRAVSYAKHYKLKLIFAFFSILLGVIFSLIEPYIWALNIKFLFQMNFNKVLEYIIYLIFLYIIRTPIGAFQNYILQNITENIIMEVKKDLFDKVLKLPVKAFDDISIGEFMSRINGDAAAIANIVINQLTNNIIDIIKVFVISFFMFSINIPLTLLVLILFPATLIINRIYGKKMRSTNELIAKTNDKYFNNIQQSISGIREIKVLGIMQARYDSFSKILKELYNYNIKNSIKSNIMQILSQFVSFATYIAILLVGSYLIIVKKTLKIELFMTFTSYAQQFSGSLLNVTRIYSNLQIALTSLERIFKMIDNLDYPKLHQGSIEKMDLIKNIRFNNVSFGYEKEKLVLKNISLSIGKNKKIAIVGKSGSGKTTLFNLLLKFYEPLIGSITIDDININEINETSYNRLISVVRQEPFFFNMSIMDNLLLANRSASNEEIYKACEDASIHDFILKLSNQYNTLIGDMGVNFSTGQKQRFSIARALLKKSPIILFDEATSSLDNESQWEIKKAINKLTVEHTIIIIAHRLSTIIEADEIVILEDGEFVGSGKHSDLIINNTFYMNLYEKELEILNENNIIAS